MSPEITDEELADAVENATFHEDECPYCTAEDAIEEED